MEPSIDFIVLTPKIGATINDNFHIALGGYTAFVPGASAGLIYGVGTIGNPDANLTIGAGFAYEISKDSKSISSPAFVVGGAVRASKGFGLVSENYIIPGSPVIVLTMLGVRFFGEKMTFDLGFVNVPGIYLGFTGIPYAGLAVKF